jgi:hypothetical protein
MEETTWSDWSDWSDYLSEQSYPEGRRYLSAFYQYEIKFFGNENFESPKLKSGLVWKYLNPSETTVFFNSESVEMKNSEYVSSALFTHSGDVPSSSTIQYGITQSDSSNIEDYYLHKQLIEPNKQSILLSRYNEPLTTTNYKLYRAINGRWYEGFSVEVYKYNSNNLEGTLVDSSLYTVNSYKGEVIFETMQSISDLFLICIKQDTSFKFICKITNYGKETAFIDHIDLIYNVMKRIPSDSNGTIIHKTIDNRI